MTTNIYTGIVEPYEVQLIHDTSASTRYMTPLPEQQSGGANNPWEHKLSPGVYMVTLTYNGAASASIRHVDGGTELNSLLLPYSTDPSTRSTPPIKISVNSPDEYLQVRTDGTGDYRATISIIPAQTYNSFDTSTGATTVNERFTQLETDLTGKADQTTLDTRIPETLALRRDTTVGTRIMAGDTMVSGKIPTRNISGIFSGALTGGSIRVSRVDNLMYFEFGYANIADDTQITMSLPAGWRPIATTTEKLHAANGAEVGEIYISWAGSLTFKKFSGPSINDTAIFVCDTWPTTLIGTPD